MRKFKAIPGKGIVAATKAESKTDLTLDSIITSSSEPDDDTCSFDIDKYTLAGWYFEQDMSSLPELAEYCGVDYDDDMETDDVLDQITDEQFVDYILQSEFAEAFYDEFA